jgi:hypothetical protein
MRTVLLNLKLWTALTVAASIFASCSKDEDPAIDTGTVHDADIVAFTFEGIEGRAAIDKTARTVAANAGETVDLTALVAGFTLSQDAAATVAGIPQISGQTVNNFSSPVIYLVTSGDGETASEWTVTVTGGAAGTAVSFQKRTFATVKEVIDFFPEGVYVYEWEDKSWNNDIELYAKASDGSFTFSEINGDPKSPYYEDVGNWYVWKDESYHSVNYTNDTKDPVTRYWQVQGDFPGENLTQSTDTKTGMKAVAVSAPWGGTASAAPSETTDGVSLLVQGIIPYLSFIVSNDCENAVFEGNATVEGIACKKYSVADYAGEKTYYYVLDNGFCLKRDGSEGIGSWTDFSLKKGERTASSCDAVLQKYYRNSRVHSSPTSIASMQILTHMHNGSEWLGGSSPGSSGWVIPWTAGGIKWMSLFYDLGKTFPHTRTVELDPAKFSDADRQAYFAQVRAIPYMKVKSDSNVEGFVNFESNNNDDALSAGLTFGESYYYVGYDYYSYLGGMCRLTVYWVRVTIV